MTTSIVIPLNATLTAGLDEAHSAIDALKMIAGEFSGGTFLRASVTVHANSADEVDRAARIWGTEARWVNATQYRAEKRGGAVWIAAAYVVDPLSVVKGSAA